MSDRFDYSIKNLCHIFEEHAKKSAEMQKKQIENFRKENPGEELPEWFKDDFNFPQALKSMCEEILRIQKRLNLT